MYATWNALQEERQNINVTNNKQTNQYGNPADLEKKLKLLGKREINYLEERKKTVTVHITQFYSQVTCFQVVFLYNPQVIQVLMQICSDLEAQRSHCIPSLQKYKQSSLCAFTTDKGNAMHF